MLRTVHITATVILAMLAIRGFTSAIEKPKDFDNPSPIKPVDTVFIEELTWMEVRDAMKAGKNTVIIPTGGVEQNGPYLITGKHNYIIHATSESIARKLGNALVAPVVAFVPEGDIDPPTIHMSYPGTISLTENTYEALLTDICASFRTHGFQHIVLIGDSTGNQRGMKRVADRLNIKWAKEKVRVHYIAAYYDQPDIEAWLEKNGVKQRDEGIHDDFATTATLVAVDPKLVRYEQRKAADKLSINGVKITPVERTADWGRKIIDLRAEATVTEIKKVIK